MEVSFIEALGELFRNLPEHPIAFFGVISVLLSVVAMVFFRQAHHFVQLFAFVLLFAGASGVVLAALAFGQPQPVELSSADAPPVVTSPVGAASAVAPSQPLKSPFSFLPEHENVLVFDATEAKEVGLKLARCFKQGGDILQVDFSKNWKDEWEMGHTRIYYQGANNAEYAIEVAKKMPGLQYVIDYDNQKPDVEDDKKWKDAPDGAFRYMGGMSSERDIIIFAGMDIATWLASSDDDECLVDP